MINLLNLYEEELINMEHWEEIKSDMYIKITTQQALGRWYGLESLSVIHTVFEDDMELYAIELIKVNKIVRQSRKPDVIKDKLLNLNKSGLTETLAAFKTLDEAEAYIKENYKIIDLETEINKLLENK